MKSSCLYNINSFSDIKDSSSDLDTLKEATANDLIILCEKSGRWTRQVLAFSEMKSIPIIDIPTSRGVITNGHPMYKGMEQIHKPITSMPFLKDEQHVYIGGNDND